MFLAAPNHKFAIVCLETHVAQTHEYCAYPDALSTLSRDYFSMFTSAFSNVKPTFSAHFKAGLHAVRMTAGGLRLCTHYSL